ncbi:LOW QUALITY PROTEIN: kanadaptin [Drosophila ficusphila]|uniref:LOW QUALITY PROTEIN: kanadaptin n=1 Tax=Drosophila ficusphila TaxID=30025 RepID=UPI001C8ACD0B|nr:LOW QUALITY PROTEIN: kanadaptin [Drosophila ficusphila]
MNEFKVPAPLPKPKVIITERPRSEVPAEPPPPPPPKTPKVPKSSPAAVCPYKVPKWSAPPSAGQNYSFEVLKSGQIIDTVRQLQQQAVWTFGRLPENDVPAAHPTISRFHVVLQYKPKSPPQPDFDDTVEKKDAEDQEDLPKNEQPEGWYIYDMGSTHGTFLNKQRVPPKVYIRMRVGHMLKLGGSTRVYILQGPGEDEEPESELSVTELRKKRDKELADAALERELKLIEAEERERNEGVSWGMGDDADEETDLSHNPYASTNNEELFFDDPKKTLRGFFEREGLNLEYRCDELSSGSFVCRVELPLDDSNGRPIVVEVNHKGKKKDCVVQCALEACRTLDRHGVLRQANQEAQKRKIVKSGDSDDEDEFWDRTGDIKRKKQRKENAGANVTLTYEDLLKQEVELIQEMEKVEQEIAAYQKKEKKFKALAIKQQAAGDDLDNFMDMLNEDVKQLDKTEIKKLRLEQQRLKGEQQRIERLLIIAKPTALPFSTISATAAKQATGQESGAARRQLPMIGKRNQFSKFKVVKALPSTQTKPQSNAFASDEEEVEEEEPRETLEENKEERGKKEAVEKQLSPDNENFQEIKPPAQTEVSEPTNAETEVLKPDDVMSTKVSTETPTAPSDTVASTLPAEPMEETGAPADETPEPEAESEKKPRPRQRQRNKQRQDVDMDLDELAEHEDSEKYAKWVPPSNQSGDGITHLNEKFGY